MVRFLFLFATGTGGGVRTNPTNPPSVRAWHVTDNVVSNCNSQNLVVELSRSSFRSCAMLAMFNPPL